MHEPCKSDIRHQLVIYDEGNAKRFWSFPCEGVEVGA